MAKTTNVNNKLLNTTPYSKKYGKGNIAVLKGNEIGVDVSYDSRPDKIDTNEILKLFNSKFGDYKIPANIENLVNDVKDKDFRRDYIENIYQYREAIRSSNCGIDTYFNAVRFTTYITMGFTQIQSYRYTYPDKVKKIELRYELENKSKFILKQAIGGKASAFAHTKIVQKLLELTLVPDHIIYRDVHHGAIKTLASIMNDNNVLAKDRIGAADSILKYTTRPEEIVQKEATLDVLGEIKELSASLAKKQLESIKKGNSGIQEVAEIVLDESEYHSE